MRLYCLVAINLFWAISLFAGEETKVSSSDNVRKVAQLLEQLASTQFAEREEASRALDELGAAALPALRKATRGDNPEISRRAQAILRRIERRLENEQLNQPKKVR